jgi:integrase
MERLINRANYLLVNEFLLFLREVKQVSPDSAERYRFYLRHLLLWTMDILLSKAHMIRPTFPAYLATRVSPRGGTLAAETQKKIIEIVRQFFEWARLNHTSEFRAISAAWIELLRPARQKQALAPEEHVFVTVEEAILLSTLPGEDGDLAHWRDRAAAARLFLTGERANALVTSPIEAINFEDNWVRQWPELGVKTKNGKKATTFLLPVPELMEVAQSWDRFIRASLPGKAPWYAPLENHWGEHSLSTEPPGENRNHALDRRLRRLFAQAGLSYKSAHKFRHGHAVYGLLHARTMADYKAVSMNLMHHDLQITDSIYASMLSNDVQKRIAHLASQPVSRPDDDLRAMVSRLSNADLSKVMMIVAERLAE